MVNAQSLCVFQSMHALIFCDCRGYAIYFHRLPPMKNNFKVASYVNLLLPDGLAPCAHYSAFLVSVSSTVKEDGNVTIGSRLWGFHEGLLSA